MVNEAIVGGLISALSRGESLQRAMMTFFNAGYSKEEIEGAAQEVYSKERGIHQQIISKGISKSKIINKVHPKKIIPNGGTGVPMKEGLLKRIGTKLGKKPTSQKISSYGKEDLKIPPKKNAPVANKVEKTIRNPESAYSPEVQRVSHYERGPPKPINKALVYLLVVLLLFLLGALAAIFLFREDLIGVFNNIGLG